MRFGVKTILLLASLLAVVLVLAGRTRTAPPEQTVTNTNYEPQVRTAGEVTIEVKPEELISGQPARFKVSFDTHSEELDFEVAEIASLSGKTGGDYGQPIWDGAGPGGHHRQGTLMFLPPLQEQNDLTLTILGQQFFW